MGTAEERLEHAVATGASELDVAPLVRQVDDARLPTDALDRELLRTLGVRVADSGATTTEDGWFPTWLHGHPAHLRDAVRAVPAHADRFPVPADPIVAARIGFQEYRSPAQRDAVRAAMRMPPGGVMTVVLPTGTGKSLVGQVRALAGRGTTVVIVPTTALARDQERLMRAAVERDRHSERPALPDLPDRMAYHGGLTDPERAAMREALRTGAQRLIFCSPEAAVRSLRPALDALASRGELDALVVDECHLVDAWGDSFRPEFQLLPALRRRLLAATDAAGSPRLVTILLTATMTSATSSVLTSLFGAGEDGLVEQATLRPEPRFLTAPCADDEERDGRLVELLARAPRPAIVYTTRPRDARRVAGQLRAAGFTRVTEFHGDCSAAERTDALAAWTSPDGGADVMVATSAFGVGVDVPDVRTVVHACLPESVDRLWQEVGRGGRDGNVSLSVLMPVIHRGRPSEDERIARALAKERTIGDRLGANRWRSMRLRGRVEEGRLEVDVTTIPMPNLELRPDIVYRSDKNTAWNWSTLNLLVRSGAISLELPPPPTLPADTTDGDAARLLEEASRWVAVQAEGGVPPHEGAPDDLEASFRSITSATRAMAVSAADDSIDRVLRIATGEACVVEQLRAEYSRHTSRGPLVPAGSCPGCPASPQQVATPTELTTAAQVTLFPTAAPATKEQASSHPTFVALPDDARGYRRQVRPMLERAVEAGARHVLLLGAVPGLASDERLLAAVPPAVVPTLTTTRREPDGAEPPVPWVAFVAPGEPVPASLLLLRDRIPAGTVCFPETASTHVDGEPRRMLDVVTYRYPHELGDRA